MKRLLILIVVCCFATNLNAQEMSLQEQIETQGVLLGIKQGMSKQEAYKILKNRCGADNVEIDGATINIYGGKMNGCLILFGAFDFDINGCESYFIGGYITIDCISKSSMDYIYSDFCRSLDAKYGFLEYIPKEVKRESKGLGLYEVSESQGCKIGLSYKNFPNCRFMIFKDYHYNETSRKDKFFEIYQVSIHLIDKHYIEVEDF